MFLTPKEYEISPLLPKGLIELRAILAADIYPI